MNDEEYRELLTEYRELLTELSRDPRMLPLQQMLGDLAAGLDGVPGHDSLAGRRAGPTGAAASAGGDVLTAGDGGDGSGSDEKAPRIA